MHWFSLLKNSLATHEAKAWRTHANTEESAFRQMLKNTDDFPKLQWDNLNWTGEVHMTKVQREQVWGLICSGAKVWSMVQHRTTGAYAAALRFDLQWVLVFEDGSVTYGRVPRFPMEWPKHLKLKNFKPKDKTFSVSNALGGFSLTRY